MPCHSWTTNPPPAAVAVHVAHAVGDDHAPSPAESATARAGPAWARRRARARGRRRARRRWRPATRAVRRGPARSRASRISGRAPSPGRCRNRTPTAGRCAARRARHRAEQVARQVAERAQVAGLEAERGHQRTVPGRCGTRAAYGPTARVRGAFSASSRHQADAHRAELLRRGGQHPQLRVLHLQPRTGLGSGSPVSRGSASTARTACGRRRRPARRAARRASTRTAASAAAANAAIGLVRAAPGVALLRPAAGLRRALDVAASRPSTRRASVAVEDADRVAAAAHQQHRRCGDRVRRARRVSPTSGGKGTSIQARAPSAPVSTTRSASAWSSVGRAVRRSRPASAASRAARRLTPLARRPARGSISRDLAGRLQLPRLAVDARGFPLAGPDQRDAAEHHHAADRLQRPSAAGRAAARRTAPRTAPRSARRTTPAARRAGGPRRCRRRRRSTAATTESPRTGHQPARSCCPAKSTSAVDARIGTHADQAEPRAARRPPTTMPAQAITIGGSRVVGAGGQHEVGGQPDRGAQSPEHADDVDLLRAGEVEDEHQPDDRHERRRRRSAGAGAGRAAATSTRTTSRMPEYSSSRATPTDRCSTALKKHSWAPATANSP